MTSSTPRVLEDLLTAYSPDLEADIVSAGYRVGKTAPAALVGTLRAGRGPLPRTGEQAHVDRPCAPTRTRRASRRCGVMRGLPDWRSTWSHPPRGSQITWPARVLTRILPAASTTSMAATEITFEHETWSMIKGRSTFTAAYNAPGGPDVWWSARADHTLTRVRIVPGSAPTRYRPADHVGESVDTAGLFVSVRRSARRALRREPGDRPALRAADRFGGRARR